MVLFNPSMKLRTTTPVLKSKTTRKWAVLFVCAVIATIVPLQIISKQVGATCQSVSECDAEIAARQRDIITYQAETDRLSAQVATLQSALATISSQKAVIQAQLGISQAQYDKLVQQIADTEQKIKDNQNALGTVIADLYVNDKITPIEMLASSKTISDYLDKQEYRSSVRDQLTATITEIKQLKATLVTQKSDVEVVLTQQKSERDAIAAKEAEQSNILAVTQGQESNYQNLISQNQSAIAQARAYQAALTARFNGSGGYTLVAGGLLGDYPWNQENCPFYPYNYMSYGGADGIGGDRHGYGCRQCASYVAWRMAKETNIYPSWGDAVNFTAGAESLGYQEGGPQAGSIAVMDPAKAGQYHGHVAWVEAVSGNQVLVSQYNYDYGAGYGMYSEMWLSSAAFDHYIHIK